MTVLDARTVKKCYYCPRAIFAKNIISTQWIYMKLSYRFTTLILLSLSVFLTHAEVLSYTILKDIPEQNINYESQRKIYIQAEKMLKRSSYDKYRVLEKQLINYPLYPYLQQKKLLFNISLKNKKLIGKFLNQYEGTPLDRPLRKKWLNHLIKKKRYQLYVDFYRPTNDARMTCLYYKSQLKVGVSENEILPKLTPLWLKGKSQPNDCDAL